MRILSTTEPTHLKIVKIYHNFCNSVCVYACVREYRGVIYVPLHACEG